MLFNVHRWFSSTFCFFKNTILKRINRWAHFGGCYLLIDALKFNVNGEWNENHIESERACAIVKWSHQYLCHHSFYSLVLPRPYVRTDCMHFLSFHLNVTWMNLSHIEMCDVVWCECCMPCVPMWQSMILIFIALFLCANGYKQNYRSHFSFVARQCIAPLDWCSLTVLLQIDKLTITSISWLKMTTFRVLASNDERGRMESVKFVFCRFLEVWNEKVLDALITREGSSRNCYRFRANKFFGRFYGSLFFYYRSQVSITHGSFGPFSPQSAIRSMFIRRLLHFVIRQNVENVQNVQNVAAKSVFNYRQSFIMFNILSTSDMPSFHALYSVYLLGIFSSSNPTQAMPIAHFNGSHKRFNFILKHGFRTASFFLFFFLLSTKHHKCSRPCCASKNCLPN